VARSSLLETALLGGEMKVEKKRLAVGCRERVDKSVLDFADSHRDSGLYKRRGTLDIRHSDNSIILTREEMEELLGAFE
jgi:hypothetical protein